MNIRIRHLEPGDETSLERVAVDVFDEAIRPERLRAYLAEPNQHLIVALKEDEVVGQIRAAVHKNPDTADQLYIDNLGVTPALQRQGIASELLAAMLELGRASGCEEAWLATEETNQQARGFYESFGVQSEHAMVYFFKL